MRIADVEIGKEYALMTRYEHGTRVRVEEIVLHENRPAYRTRTAAKVRRVKVSFVERPDRSPRVFPAAALSAPWEEYDAEQQRRRAVSEERQRPGREAMQAVKAAMDAADLEYRDIRFTIYDEVHITLSLAQAHTMAATMGLWTTR